MTYIYLITNIEGDKIYIGKTNRKYNREYCHKKRFGNQICIDYIDSIDTEDSAEWKKLEVFWIEQFRQWGFKLENKNSGGGGVSRHTESSRNKISLSNRGKKRSAEVIVKLPLFKKGNKLFLGRRHSDETKLKLRNCNLGKKHSEETKLKISNAKKGIRAYDNNREVNQYDLNGVFLAKFNSLTEASIKTGSSRSKISACCRNKRKTTNNFKWEYYN